MTTTATTVPTIPATAPAVRRGSLNISNQRFGRLVAQYPTKLRDSSGSYIWSCVCDCGTTKNVSLPNLRNGSTQSCGHQHIFKELTGLSFGRLLVLHRADSDNRGEAFWFCKCVCGNHVKVSGSNLRFSRQESCGCLRDELSAHRFKQLQAAGMGVKHGHARVGRTTREVQAYWSAKSRCVNPNNRSWKNYGGRGIKFLFASFFAFYVELGDKPTPKHLYSLDRIDNDGNYEVGNVRWATKSQQQANRRRADAGVQ
jgi:hypothetical protein